MTQNKSSIEQEIADLEKKANEPHRTHSAFENGVDAGFEAGAKKALKIIKSLQAKLDTLEKCYSVTNESWKELKEKLDTAKEALNYIRACDVSYLSAQKALDTLKLIESINDK